MNEDCFKYSNFSKFPRGLKGVKYQENNFTILISRFVIIFKMHRNQSKIVFQN